MEEICQKAMAYMSQTKRQCHTMRSSDESSYS